MPMRPEPTSPPCRSGLPAWAILSTPGKRTSTSSSVPGPVFMSAPQPPMLVPLPGMKQIVVMRPDHVQDAQLRVRLIHHLVDVAGAADVAVHVHQAGHGELVAVVDFRVAG